MLRVTFLGDVWDRLRDRCEQSAPLEDGGFVLARPVETTSGARLVVDEEVSLPSTGDRWNIQEEFRLRPTTEYKSVAMGESYQMGRVPFFVHTHPNGPTAFSPVDEEMHAAWLRDFVEESTHGVFGSLVIHGNDIVGALWTGPDYDNDRHPIDVVNCCGTRPVRSVRQLDDEAVGDLLDEGDDASPATPHPGSRTEEPDWLAVTDRQIRLIERLGQERLRSARIGIVGLGGTGSAATIECGRSGIGSLLLVDPDTAEVSNTNRLYTLTLEQAENEVPKTTVLEDHLEQTILADVDVAQNDVVSGDLDAALLDCDIILGCTDRHTPRAYLNELSVVYGIPYIDMGARATARDGIVLDLLAEARHVVNGGPCLRCLDVVDDREIRRENLPSELVEQEVEDGYLRGDDPEPSNILMTTLAATMGVTQALAYLLNQENAAEEKVLFNLWCWDLHRESPDRDEDCLCRQDYWVSRNDDLSALSL